MHLGTSTIIKNYKKKKIFKIMIEIHSIQKGQTKLISKDQMNNFMNSKIKMFYKIKLKEGVW